MMRLYPTAKQISIYHEFFSCVVLCLPRNIPFLNRRNDLLRISEELFPLIISCITLVSSRDLIICLLCARFKLKSASKDKDSILLHIFEAYAANLEA